MITIKLQEVSGNGYHIEKGKGKIKYMHETNDYPIEIGENLCFRGHKPWIVLDVFVTREKRKVK